MDTHPGAIFGANAMLYEAAARLAKLGVWECDLATERLTWSNGVYEIFGLSPGTALKRTEIVDLYAEESRREMELLRQDVIVNGRSGALDVRIRTRQGEARWMRLWIDVAYEGGQPVRLYGAKQDITEEVQALERLRRIAEHDALTGLANRAVFDKRYRAIVSDPLNHASAGALVLIDVDHFKPLNDDFGHAAGDACLRRIASRLSRLFADALLVARIGGDEFAVFLRAPMIGDRLRKILAHARTALCRPMVWNGRRIDTAVSIGATIIGEPSVRKPSELFAEADAALYAAKAAGRGTVRVFGDVSRPAETNIDPP